MIALFLQIEGFCFPSWVFCKRATKVQNPTRVEHVEERLANSTVITNVLQGFITNYLVKVGTKSVNLVKIEMFKFKLISRRFESFIIEFARLFYLTALEINGSYNGAG